MFEGRKILLGVTGGIAAYKSCLLVRELQKRGAEVRVVMTHAATQMVGKATFEALSRHPVPTTMFSSQDQDYFRHIDTVRWADLMIVAPCTANTIGNLAAGLTPDYLGLMFLAAKIPKILVPSMNVTMWENPVVQSNLNRLREFGVQVLEPSAGYLACGEVGPGRYPEECEIVDFIENALFPAPTKPLVLISMGRTEEPLDPVRYLTNRSSGKTGLSLAEYFRKKGHPVEIVSGPCEVDFPRWLPVQKVRTVREMDEALQKSFARCGVLIMAASIADFRPKLVSDSKIKETRNLLNLELEPNPDLLKHFSQVKTKDQVVVGFALESDNAEQNGLDKLRRKGCDLLVLNTPLKTNSGIGFDQVEYTVLSASLNQCPPLQMGSKAQLAEDLYQAYQNLERVP